jgi:GT2 family glycosyltransferase
MPHSVKERITIGWCDGGMVEGRFMSGVVNTIIEAPKHKLNIVNTIRVQGNQIARQRQSLWDFWDKLSDSEWLLWVDSDIVITPQIVNMLWEVADKKTKPVVTGVYFVSSENEQSLMEPVPAIYRETGDPYRTQVILDLPENQVIPIDVAGFGLMLMHKSIIEPVKKVAGDISVFGENQQAQDKFVSEDVSFCRNLKKAGIQLYAHTGATVQHMKTFSFDKNYFNLYWNGIQTEFVKKPGRNKLKPNVAQD